MKTRFMLFCIVGILIGACAGVITTLVGVEIVVDMQSNHSIGQRYIHMFLKGAIIWAGFGLVSGVLLFASSLGETPIATDTSGRPLGGKGIEHFDYRRVGRKSTGSDLHI